jgi:uncharacterized protein (DUF302 family)
MTAFPHRRPWRHALIAVLLAIPATVPAQAPDGITTRPSPWTVAETVDRFRQAIEERKARLFAVIDHGAEAAAVGDPLRPVVLIVFGNPRVGSPLMRDAPTIGLDLPLKLLVWEAADGTTRVSFTDPESIVARHGLPPVRAQALRPLPALVQAVLDGAGTASFRE